MLKQEWPAQDYAIGSYIQATIAEPYLSHLSMAPSDIVLDIGCGNGAFTKKILDKVPQGSVLGIDASKNMLELAKNVSYEYPNFSIKNADVHTMRFISEFNYIVSFWCLQWSTDISSAFLNIFNALEQGGKVLALFPAGDDPYIMGYHALKQSRRFEALEHFKAPIDYSRFDNLAQKLSQFPYKHLNVELCPQSMTLPSLDVFRKFVNGIAFYQGQVSTDELAQINDALVDYFATECEKNHNGEYRFNFTMYLITGQK